MNDKYVHLTFKINVPKSAFESREKAIEVSMEAMKTEVPRFVDWLMDGHLD